MDPSIHKIEQGIKRAMFGCLRQLPDQFDCLRHMIMSWSVPTWVLDLSITSHDITTSPTHKSSI